MNVARPHPVMRGVSQPRLHPAIEFRMDQLTTTDSTDAVKSLWRVMMTICACVVLASILSCLAIAEFRSSGLTRVTVTAIDAAAEPKDHSIPLIKRKDALPDYEVLVFLNDGERIDLGTRPNSSAADGLTWALNDPVSVSDVAGVRLQDQDKLVSDAITEVQITGPSVSSDNYTFEFTTERSASIGFQSFFRTPVGKVISGAFFIALVVVIVCLVAI
ncbi:MAG TPA: hypothetical protein DDW52_19665 [Planctomycetaceae bacterium]|nr:hypothetical protein [Planctomycetaceae bacterium]